MKRWVGVLALLGTLLGAALAAQETGTPETGAPEAEAPKT